MMFSTSDMEHNERQIFHRNTRSSTAPLENCLNQLAANHDDEDGNQSSTASRRILMASSSVETDRIGRLQRLRPKLEYFFMDPIKKWKHRNTRPWKLIVQILKVALFTAQLVLFGSNMAKFITYKDEMQVTFKQLFLKDWDPSADAVAYPGPYVPYAVYTKPDFMNSINYAIKIYSNVTNLSIGTFGYKSNSSDEVSPIDICITNLVQAEFEPTMFKYNYSMFTSTECKTIEKFAPAGSELWSQFDIRHHLEKPIDFSKLISVKLNLPIRTLLIEDATSGDSSVVCFNIDIELFYDNLHRDGQIVITLTSSPVRAKCEGHLVESTEEMTERQLLNILVMSFCILSFSLCARSLWRTYRLVERTRQVLRLNGFSLELQDVIEFLDPWLLMIIVNDLLIGWATIIIALHDNRLLETNNYTFCSILIGLGNFLSWSGLLRYLSFFKKYNLLIVTLRKSFFHVARFMLCTMLLYCGFCFCGWVVFGPYHFKFRQLSTTTECLFALINGDDMFETFALLRSETNLIWWFSRIYLYVFVSLFIYVVLSLFIALIMDAYEIIKQYSDNGFPKSRLQTFYLDGDTSKLAPATG